MPTGKYTTDLLVASSGLLPDKSSTSPVVAKHPPLLTTPLSRTGWQPHVYVKGSLVIAS